MDWSGYQLGFPDRNGASLFMRYSAIPIPNFFVNAVLGDLGN